MTTEISLFSLFAEATWVVKFIMLSLLAISVTSWTFIFQRAKYFRDLQELEYTFENQLSSGKDITELYQSISNSKRSGLLEVFKAGCKEFFLNTKNRKMNEDAILDSSKRAMDAAVNHEIAELEKNLSFLATVGSVSPYVGLFGTVWGIMHSFIALGSVQQATLSMVAPGIAEALIATAIGLFAAIPAVIAYNKYANRVNELANKYERFQINFTNILARNIYSS